VTGEKSDQEEGGRRERRRTKNEKKGRGITM
jgi:hypothetical protein